MSVEYDETVLIGAVGLFERAVGYTRLSLRYVSHTALTSPTPCSGWNLGALLRHMDDSLAALQEAADVGYVALQPRTDDWAVDIVAALRARACALLGAWAGKPGDGEVSVAGRLVSGGILASTGALEVAVHGWDVARACGHHRPLPPRFAEELLELVPLLVSDDDRPVRFASPVHVPTLAPAGDRLLGFLGRPS